MKTFRHAFAVFCSLFILHVSTAASEAVTVTGRVLNAATGYYLKSAEVRVEGTDNVVYTEDGGVYSITVPAGRVTLTASYTSVQSATVSIDAAPGGENRADFELLPILLERQPAAAAAAGAAAATTTAVGGAATGVTAPGAAVPSSSATGAIDPNIVMLDKFQVTEERVGQAKAIMEQRAAINAKTIIATDNFGDLTQGAVGEFLKYMPGVTIEYDEDEAAGVRIGGLDPKYTGFSLDGITLASASGGSRASNFQQMSITGIESIEFNQTLTAGMDAGSSAAGLISLKSRYAFDLRRPVLRFQLGLDGTSDAIELGRAYMPDDRKHDRVYFGGQINYGGPFLKGRLGIDASVSRYSNYRNNRIHDIVYSYPAPGPLLNPGIVDFDKVVPDIQYLMWRVGPRIWTSSAANLSADWKASPYLTLSLRSSLTVTDVDYFNASVVLQAQNQTVGSDDYTGPHPGVHPETDENKLTNWVVDPLYSASSESWIYNINANRTWRNTNYLLSPRATYKKGSLQIDFRGGYSNSTRDLRDADNHHFSHSVAQIAGIGWIATRPDEGSPAWTLTQTDGTSWAQPQNWSRTGNRSYNVRSYADYSKNIQASGYLDLTHRRRLFGHPFTIKAGGSYRRSSYAQCNEVNRFNFNGPLNSQVETPLPFTKNYVFDLDLNGREGNVNDQGWRVTNHNELWRIYEEHHEWFEADESGNFLRKLLSDRNLTEQIGAGYVEFTTRYDRLQLNAGVRLEHTSTASDIIRMRPWEDILEAREKATPEQLATGMFDYTLDAETGQPSAMSSIPGILYQYYDGRRFPRDRSYNNTFLSGGLKYEITKNLRFQLSASQAILRPDYANLSGVITADPYARSVLVPNPLLDPERTTKYYAGLHWYLNPAGVLSVSAFRLDIRDKQLPNYSITAQQAQDMVGYPLRTSVIIDDAGGLINEADIRYRATVNSPSMSAVYGLTFEYNQQLTFLPGYLKGLSVFSSLTFNSLRNENLLEERIGLANKSANGGIRYRYARFNIQLRATWRDDVLISVERPLADRRWFQNDRIYERARAIVDLSGGLRISHNLELAFSIRNLTDSPRIWYSNVPGRLRSYGIFGSTWTLNLKGTY